MNLLSRKSYRQVVNKLKYFQKQHEDDRKENPNNIPIAWGPSLIPMIERTIRDNHERVYKGLAQQVLDYLVQKGFLVRYLNDYTFPSNEVLPTRDEVIERTKKLLDQNGIPWSTD